MGLIISQSALIGVAVAIFDSRLWLVNDETWMNGLNYAMGAFALQGLAYYLFKMFFERNPKLAILLASLKSKNIRISKTTTISF